MISRLAVLFLVVGVAWLAVAGLERLRRGSTSGLHGGLTLVTGADCRLCAQAIATVGGADIPVRIVDVAEFDGATVRSVPTAIVTDRHGAVVARRSGRSAITGMPGLIEAARAAL